MIENLNLLLELQTIDLEIKEKEAVAQEIPKGLKALEKEFEKSKAGLEQLKALMEEAKKYRRKKETELGDKEAQLIKYKNQLLTVKTNKEYKAILSEMENVKKTNSLLEEDILKALEEIDTLEKKQAEEQNKIKKEEENFKQKVREKEEELNRIKARIAELKNNGDAKRSLISKDLIEDYDKVRKARNNIAVVPAINEICQGCFMKLTPQFFNQIRIQDQIYKCPNCNRIIYYKE